MSSERPSWPQAGRGQSGLSLVSVMMAVAVLGIVSAVTAQMVVNSQKGTKSSELRTELNVLKQTLSRGFDCRKTLGVTGTTVLPLTACPNPLVLKHTDGTAVAPGGKMGVWSILPTCDFVGHRLLVGVTKTGDDPLTGKSWDNAAGVNGIKFKDDLFGGISDFCRDYLDPAAANGPWAPVAYSSYTGPWNQQTGYTAGDKSPDDICKSAGFSGATGMCKGNSAGGYPYLSTLLANRQAGAWALTCLYGWGDWEPPSHLRCE